MIALAAIFGPHHSGSDNDGSKSRRCLIQRRGCSLGSCCCFKSFGSGFYRLLTRLSITCNDTSDAIFQRHGSFGNDSDLPARIPLLFTLCCCLGLFLFFLFFLAVFGLPFCSFLGLFCRFGLSVGFLA
jgi:hypothetical protein